ncbi:MAG: hypothetical protein HY081_02915 [Gammaproteobacteria bacterium]|nr:hypothetical protein [Gammaproteobacteria bacterium]
MKTSIRTYIGLITVLLISVGVSIYLPSELFKSIAALPAVGALVGALYQIFRDQSLFEKQEYLQRQQQIFNLGASSHMAQSAFDKHVSFCEEYMEEVHDIVSTLFAHGPTEKVMPHLRRLFEIRRKYSAWITKDIGLLLEPFENALNEIGALSHFEKMLEGGDKQARSNAIEKMFSIFKKVINLKDEKIIEENKEVAIEEVKAKIRNIIGIEELSEMRKKIISVSLAYLRKDT